MFEFLFAYFFINIVMGIYACAIRWMFGERSWGALATKGIIDILSFSIVLIVVMIFRLFRWPSSNPYVLVFMSLSSEKGQTSQEILEAITQNRQSLGFYGVTEVLQRLVNWGAAWRQEKPSDGFHPIELSYYLAATNLHVSMKNSDWKLHDVFMELIVGIDRWSDIIRR
jgi:hypothetical protein